MKVVNNKNESKKRKRDESQGAIAESPKKAKVHAQRKFAQGASYNSPSIPLIKDKVRPPANVNNSGLVLSTKRPNTEDFLTFLCFRRTQILPNKLDYFNNAFKEQFSPSNNIEVTQTSTGSQRNNHHEHSAKSSARKSDKNETQKKVQTPVQALRRKYQEQRLAKQNPANLRKLAQKVKGKNMVRTRSSTMQEEKVKPAKELVLLNDGKEALSGLRSGLQRAPPPTSKYLKRRVKVVEMKNLRSRDKEKTVGNKIMTNPTFAKKSLRYSSKEISPKKSEATRNVKPSEISKSGDTKVNTKKIEGLSDFSSDDNEPLLAVKRGKPIMKPKRLTNGMREVPRPNSMKTRSQNSDISEPILNSSLRPTRKTKEAAAIYMEMITKKLVSPEKSGDDDRSSVDSFPELPNAKRNEQRETEIKAMAMRKGNSRGKNTNLRLENKKISKVFHKKREMRRKNRITPGKAEFMKKITKDNEVKKSVKPESTKKNVRDQTKKVVKTPIKKKQAKEEILKKFAKNELSKKYMKEEVKSRTVKGENGKNQVKDEKKKKAKEEVSKKVAREDSSKKAHEESKKNQKSKREDLSNKNTKEENTRVSDDSSKKNSKEESGKKLLKEEVNKKAAQEALLEDSVKKPVKDDYSRKKEESGKKSSKEEISKKVTHEVLTEDLAKKSAKEESSKKKEESGKKSLKEEVHKKGVQEVSSEDPARKSVKDDYSRKKEESGKKSSKEEISKKVTHEVLTEDLAKKSAKEESSKKKEESGKKSLKEEVHKKGVQEVSSEDPARKSVKDDSSKKKDDPGKKSAKEENKKAVQEVSLEDSTKKPIKLESSKKKEDLGKKTLKEDVSKKVTQDVLREDSVKKPLKEDCTRRKEEIGRKTQPEDVAKKTAKDEPPKKNVRDEVTKKRGAEDLSRKVSKEESCEGNVKETELDEPLKKIMKGESIKKLDGTAKRPVKEDVVKKGEDPVKEEPDANTATLKKGTCDDGIKKISKDNVKKTVKEEAQKKSANEDSPTKICKDELPKKGMKDKKDSKFFDENAFDELNEMPKSDVKKEKLVENVSSVGFSVSTLTKVPQDLTAKPEVVNDKQTKEVQKITENDHEMKDKRDESEKEPCIKSDGQPQPIRPEKEKAKEIKEELVKNTPDEAEKKVLDSEEDRGEIMENSVETKEVDGTQKRNAKNACKESEDDSVNNKSDEAEVRPSTRGRKIDEPETKSKKAPDRAIGSKRSNSLPKKGCATGSSVPGTNWLPPPGSASNLVEAPTFYPTEKEFQDPLEFFERIRPAAENFGLCRIVPPSTFKPDCKVSDDMRFTAYNQYVHRMFHRWGPNIKEMMAIKKYLATQSISLKQPPWIGGIEVDLPRLYQSVQNCGGLMKVMEKKKWNQVADMMRIPKAAQDRVTKLDDIYCKYLLPYDTLSQAERQKLFDEVESDWSKRQDSTNDSADDESEEEFYIDECEECIVKGRNMALNQFYRIARNTMSMWFKTQEPLPSDVENEFWRHVSERNNHVCVHSGSIDSSGWGYGFPVAKNNTFSKHPWNLKVLTNNSGSVLRSLGPVMGVTVPTLHVGMVFTAFCWYRDPHGLPWVEYLHTGAPKIWYGISDDNSSVFKEALTKLLPRYIKNKKIWLPSDTAMVPPALLVEQGVSLCHTIQNPGQFILVFPRAFTSSICTGYLVSESVYFAQSSWLSTAEQVFRDIQDCCEPTMFSLEKLLFSIATDSRSSVEVLKQVLPMVWHIKQNEIDGRKTLLNLGLKLSERLPVRDQGGGKRKKGRWAQDGEGDYECEVCRTNLCVSLVINSQEETVLCLPHAIELLTQKRHQLKYCKLMYSYTQEELCELVEKLEQKIESKSQKKMQNKSSSSSK